MPHKVETPRDVVIVPGEVRQLSSRQDAAVMQEGLYSTQYRWLFCVLTTSILIILILTLDGLIIELVMDDMNLD